MMPAAARSGTALARRQEPIPPPIRATISHPAPIQFKQQSAGVPMNDMIQQHGLKVASSLAQFVEEEAIPGTGVDAAAFWQGFDALVHDLAPKNRALLAERDRMQSELDEWHRSHPGPVRDLRAYRKFLEDIGYIVP